MYAKCAPTTLLPVPVLEEHIITIILLSYLVVLELTGIYF